MGLDDVLEKPGRWEEMGERETEKGKNHRGEEREMESTLYKQQKRTD